MAFIKGDRFEYVNVKYGVRHRVGLHGTVESGPYHDKWELFYKVYFDYDPILYYVYAQNMKPIDRDTQIGIDVSAYL